MTDNEADNLLEYLSYREAIAVLGLPLALRLTRYTCNGVVLVHRDDIARMLREHERREHRPRVVPKGERRKR